MLKVNLKKKKKKKTKRERERKRRGKGEEKQRKKKKRKKKRKKKKRGAERGGNNNEGGRMDSSPTTDSSTYTQSIQRSKHHNSNGLLKLKRKRKYKKKVQNPAERLEMSRIRSAQTICSGKYRVLYTYILEYVFYIALLQHFFSQIDLLYCPRLSSRQTQWIEREGIYNRATPTDPGRIPPPFLISNGLAINPGALLANAWK